jgi:hypothetical protein
VLIFSSSPPEALGMTVILLLPIFSSMLRCGEKGDGPGRLSVCGWPEHINDEKID